MDGTSEAASPKPGSAADPQTPLKVGLLKTIFWKADSFGQISKDVHSILAGSLFIYEDPPPHTGREIRSDRQDVLQILKAATASR